MSCGCGGASSCGGVSAGGLVVGVPGPRGPVGPPGPPGSGAGDKGDKGDPGRDGVDGRDGTDGAPGRDGVDGSPGADGRDGVDGAPGSDGAPGRDGVDGAPGEKGDTGPSSWAAIPDRPEGVPGGFPVLDAAGLVSAGNLPNVIAESIVDSTVVGRAVVVAADEVAARAAISAENAAAKGQPDGYAPLNTSSVVPFTHLPPRTLVDARDWDAVQAANWKIALSPSLTAGSKIVGNLALTAADVGKTILFRYDFVSSLDYKWWMTTIASVGAGTAEMVEAAPVTEVSGICHYGFDGTAAINTMLQEVNGANTFPTGVTNDGPGEVFLGGSYRLAQLVVPAFVVVRGSRWTTPPSGNVTSVGRTGMTTLAQLPGSNKDFVVFDEHPTITGWTGLQGITDLKLLGPECRVLGLPDATVGNGVAFRTSAGKNIIVQDNFEMYNISVTNFPGNGFLVHGAVPGHFDRLLATNNHGYGFDYIPPSTSATQAVHLSNFSSDQNNLGAVRLKGLSQFSPFVITNLKSEGYPEGNGLPLDKFGVVFPQGQPGGQKNCIVLEDCDRSPIVVNGVSHISGKGIVAPGPAIIIKGKRPHLVFSGVAVRVLGTESGGTADAVTIRDTVTGTFDGWPFGGDVPRTITSGYHPSLSTKFISDSNSRPVMRFEGLANSDAYLTVTSTPTGQAPTIAVSDGGALNANNSLGISPKGAGGVRINAPTGQSAKLISDAQDPDADPAVNLNLITRGAGVVQANGTQVAVKGHIHTASEVLGAVTIVNTPASATWPGDPGEVSYSNTHWYVCVAANTWVRTPLTTW